MEVPDFLFRIYKYLIRRTFHLFSIPFLLEHLFDPWKRDILYLPNASLEMQVRIWAMNMASRIVGMMVRAGTILVGLLATGTVVILGPLAVLGWYLLPLLPFFLIVLGILNL